MSSPVVIALSAIGRQTIQVPLSGIQAQLNVYQLATGLFMDIYKSGTLVMAGVLCQDRTWIIRQSSYGFPGDFIFVDTQGTSDPDYSGLSNRFALYYLEGQNV